LSVSSLADYAPELSAWLELSDSPHDHVRSGLTRVVLDPRSGSSSWPVVLLQLVPGWDQNGTRLAELDWPDNQALTEDDVKKVSGWDQKGTKLFHEKIRYQGKRMGLTSTPLFPTDHPRIKILTDEEFRVGIFDTMIGSTACWRGYIGSWSIRRDKLYLTKIEGRFRLDGKEAIFADWFTGDLHIPKGGMLDYVHTGFESVYEQEIILTLEHGVVISTETIIPTRAIGYDDLIDPSVDL